MSEGSVFNERVTIGQRRWFGLLPGKIFVERTPVPLPPGVTIGHARAASEPGEPTKFDVQLTEAELNTIVLALKFSRIRYGMLLQLAEQRGGTILSWEAIGDLKDTLDGTLSRAAAA